MSAVASPIVWDLSSLFASMDDPRIEQSWEDLNRRADAFAVRYRGKIDATDLSGSLLASALRESEGISADASKPMNYAHLLFAANTADPAIGAFMAKQMELGSALSVKLLFFDLELQAAPQQAIENALEHPDMINYAHHVRHSRAFSSYRLTEPEETVLEEVANTGSRAWVRLFEEVTANHAYKLKDPSTGEERIVGQEEVLTLLRDPDRAVRQAAADSFSAGLSDLRRVLAFTFNNLLQDKAVDDRMRGFEYPEQARHLSNELTPEIVDAVIDKCVQNYGLVERFYNLKKQILGLPTLTHVDRYAPLFSSEAGVDFDQARSIVLDAFGKLSPTLRARAEEFFDKNWIDAEPRPGKRGGAFCSYNTPDTHPVVFMSYMGKSDDVMTLAHELGHGVHSSLSRAQTYFNFHGTLPMAELASTFGEMLVFESLVQHADLKEKLALYAEKIEGVFATIFRQAAMYRFEKRCHQARREEGELPAERFGDFWQEELQAMFGSSVELGEQHRDWWSYVSHFVAAPFYVYAYSFGELVVLSLYQMAKKEGPNFEPKYIRLLTLGGSRSPIELMNTLGVDLTSAEFWDGGFAALEALVAEFERIWAEYKSTSQG